MKQVTFWNTKKQAYETALLDRINMSGTVSLIYPGYTFYLITWGMVKSINEIEED